MSTFEQGWAARPFKEQFPEMDIRDAEHLDRLNHSITDMLLSGLLTDSQVRDIRQKKFPRVVSGYVSKIKKKVKP